MTNILKDILLYLKHVYVLTFTVKMTQPAQMHMMGQILQTEEISNKVKPCSISTL